MTIGEFIIYFLVFFVGYVVGRVAHILGGHLKVPHHWIYGLGLIILSIVFWQNSWVIWFLLVGLGLLISDLKDFFNLKFFGPDDVKVKKFWGID